MEHRWGTRFAVHIPVRLTATHFSTASFGRIKNLSLSGGFITGFALRPFTRIFVSVEYSPPLQPPCETLPAIVMRVCEEGAGVIWCEFASPPVADLVRTVMGARSPVGGVAPQAIHSPIGIQSLGWEGSAAYRR
jgi:hypothetical protein